MRSTRTLANPHGWTWLKTSVTAELCYCATRRTFCLSTRPGQRGRCLSQWTPTPIPIRRRILSASCGGEWILCKWCAQIRNSRRFRPCKCRLQTNMMGVSSPFSQISAPRALFGQTAIGGRLPVSVPGVAGGHTGDGIRAPASPMTIRMATKSTEERLKPAFDMIARAVVDYAFAGGVVAVGYRGEVTIQAFGKQTYEPGAPAIRADTIYDVASLSKVIVTTTVIARLTEAHQGGRVDLDAPIARYLPEWASGPNPEWRRAVTVRHLLTHTSGLPPHQPFYKTCKSKDEVVAKIMVEPLVTAPGAKEAYSDLGVILLGEMAERVTGRSLETLARQEIFTPLGMRDTMYNPPKRLLSRIAPTENDSDYRKRLVHGVVHDENAFAMGGVAGHAGVFSTASDLSAFCQMLLNGGIYAHHRFLRRSTLNEFTVGR